MEYEDYQKAINMKFAAVIRVSEQCSPEDFEWNTYIKEVNLNTRLIDLIKWQEKTWPHKKISKKVNFIIKW